MSDTLQPLVRPTAEGELATSVDERAAQEAILALPIGQISVRGAYESLSAAQVVHAWETSRAVKEAPRFVEQVIDPERQNQYRFEQPTSPRATRSPTILSVTEADGLQELHSLLTTFVGANNGNGRLTKDVIRARDTVENLTFIGDKEYQEAAAGIGLAWRAYLDADPRRQICVLAEVNRLDKYEGQRKSDDHLRDAVLATFSDAELERYSGRIVGRLEDMNVAPEHGRVILVDDWTISGRQFKDTHTRLMHNERFRAFAQHGNVEANVIAASEVRIVQGLQTDQGTTLPVRAYYRAHHAPTARRLGYSIITGVHSSVNYGFGTVCEHATTPAQKRVGYPSLANIVPPYRHQVATIEISAGRLRRLSREEIVHAKAVAQAGTLATSEY